MKKILFITHRIPYPPNKGDKIRTFNELKYLSQSNRVDLLCLADEKNDLRHIPALQKYCHNVYCLPLNGVAAKIRGVFSLLTGRPLTSRYFYLRKIQMATDRLLAEEGYDAVLCFSSSMAEYVFESKVINLLERQPRLVLDFCDVDSAKWGQYAKESRFPMNRLYLLEQHLLRQYECRIQAEFDRTVLISADEVKLFHSFCSNLDGPTIISNGVDLDFFDASSSAREDAETKHPVIVFTGAMDYHVNVKGVLWFVGNVWPALRQQLPTLELYVVGSNPVQELINLGKQPGIIVTGFVEDIRTYYERADVCIAPLHMGRGVQNKVLEAMAMSRAVVSTTRANAGIQGVSGEHLLVADEADEFRTAVLSLLNDHEKRKRLASNARQFVVDHFNWDHNMQKLQDLLLNESMPSVASVDSI